MTNGRDVGYQFTKFSMEEFCISLRDQIGALLIVCAFNCGGL